VTTTRTTKRTGGSTAREAGASGPPQAAATPGLVAAWLPPGIVADDRAPLGGEVTVGRSSSAGWFIPDDRLSRTHFAVRREGARFLVRDLGSTNGTHVGGARLAAAREVGPGAVIRAGGCVFVVVGDIASLARPGEQSEFGVAGRFHAATIVRQIELAARSGRHVLLEGETGSGKELAARGLHAALAALGRSGPVVAHNAARYAGEQDAATMLFGVVRGAFTGVEPRTGALELAAGGTFFLDEVHNLPVRVQRSLLRFSEDGLLQRIGETPARKVDVRLLFGTNIPVDAAIADGRLAQDLVARLHRVAIPPLRERRADVPSIFAAVLSHVLPSLGIDPGPVVGALDAASLERLCLHDYRRGNVRELEDLAAVIGARIAGGSESRAAIAAALDGAVPAVVSDAREADDDSSSPSLYERRKAEIVAAYRELDGSLSRLEETLRARGIPCTRRWLAEYLERWGVRRKRGK
jgi:transcriptional regulator with AAA-type ATPase domain